MFHIENKANIKYCPAKLMTKNHQQINYLLNVYYVKISIRIIFGDGGVLGCIL